MIWTVVNDNSTVDKEKIRSMLDSLIESPKSKMPVVSSEMTAFGGDAHRY